MIGFNEQLKEQAIRQTQEDINRLTNEVFSLQNKIENLHGQQMQFRKPRLEDCNDSLQTNASSIEGTRKEWTRARNVAEGIEASKCRR